jgi:hypothetical protein
MKKFMNRKEAEAAIIKYAEKIQDCIELKKMQDRIIETTRKALEDVLSENEDLRTEISIEILGYDPEEEVSEEVPEEKVPEIKKVTEEVPEEKVPEIKKVPEEKVPEIKKIDESSLKELTMVPTGTEDNKEEDVLDFIPSQNEGELTTDMIDNDDIGMVKSSDEKNDNQNNDEWMIPYEVETQFIERPKKKK